MTKRASIVISTEDDAEIELRTGRKGSVELEVASGISAGGEYFGPYEVTPTENEQVLPTAQLIASRDIVVNPIPSNWGRITWNGSVLTVS